MKLFKLKDEELDQVSGGAAQVQRRAVDPASSCEKGFVPGLGKSDLKRCSNCFYYHPAGKTGYCSHPKMRELNV